MVFIEVKVIQFLVFSVVQNCIVMRETYRFHNVNGKNCQWVIYVVFSSIHMYLHTRIHVFLYIQYTSLLIRGGTT